MCKVFRARVVTHVVSSASNGNFQDITQQRGGEQKSSVIFLRLSSTQWHTSSGRATWHILDILYGFYSPYGVRLPVCLPFFFSVFLSALLSSKTSLILPGITAGSVRTLPHVVKYQTVIPQRLKGSSLINDAATHQVGHIHVILKVAFIYFWRMHCRPPPPPFFFLCVCRHTLMYSGTPWLSLRKTTHCTWKKTSENIWYVSHFFFDLLIWLTNTSCFRDLVGNNFSVTHYTDEGTPVTTTPDLGVCSFA